MGTSSKPNSIASWTSGGERGVSFICCLVAFLFQMSSSSMPLLATPPRFPLLCWETRLIWDRAVRFLNRRQRTGASPRAIFLISRHPRRRRSMLNRHSTPSRKTHSRRNRNRNQCKTIKHTPTCGLPSSRPFLCLPCYPLLSPLLCQPDDSLVSFVRATATTTKTITEIYF
jgi:hypothetical protein